MLPIYVDMDDVLCESTRTFVKIIEREFGIHASFENATSFDMRESFGLTQEQFAHFFRLAHLPQTIREFPLVEGSRCVLMDWVSQGHEITVVTGRPPESYEASLEWLKTNEIPFSSLVFVDKYSREDGANTVLSLERVCDMGFSLAVEDSSAIAEYIAGTMGIPVVLLDRPWNRNGPSATNIKRCYSWFEIGRIGIDGLPPKADYGLCPPRGGPV